MREQNISAIFMSHGFRVTRVTPLSELEATLYEAQHEKSGLRLIWTAREDENKTFGIAFMTLPEDDTGVFHILEHSVLCGSDKYPVKEPFVELLKNSLNTFLNAMTYPDKTYYPVCSRNDTDLLNMARVYLDAVFRPAIYHNPSIFMQEGWRLEKGENGEPAWNGVVYNEMKGAFAGFSTVREVEMERGMFPDSPYGYVSGGNPVSIPNLTYERFLDFHRRYYAPANGIMTLDGDIDLEAVLSLTDEYIKNAENTGRIPLPALQKPVDGGTREVSYEIGAEEDASSKTRVALGCMVGTYDDKERLAAADLLAELLCGSNQAPLSRAVLESGLCEDVSMSVDEETMQCIMNTELVNLKEEDISRAETLVQETLEHLCQEGLDHEMLTALIANREFRERERDFGSYPTGLILCMNMLDSALYGGKPELYLVIGDMYDDLRKKVGEGYFEKLLRELLLENPHRCRVILHPSKTLGEERRAEEAARAQDAFSRRNDAEQKQAEEKLQALHAWQEHEDTPEELATLPTLTLADVQDAKPIQFHTEEQTSHGIPLLYHREPTSGIRYFQLYFDIDDLTPEELSRLSLLCAVLNNGTAAKGHSAEELLRRKKLLTGALSFDTACFVSRKTGEMKRKFVAAFSVLPQNQKDATDLMTELLRDSVFREDEILEILRQEKIAMISSFKSRGHAAALRRVRAMYYPQGVFDEITGGYAYYRFLCSAIDEEEQKTLPGLFTELLGRIAVTSRLRAGFTAQTEEGTDLLGDQLSAALPAGTACGAPSDLTPAGTGREGIVIPADIGFAVCGGANPQGYDGFTGAQLVASRIAGLGWLWSAVRVQGGAYGTGCLSSTSGLLACYSYRDPKCGESLEKYKAIGPFLREICDAQEDLSGYIIGAVADASPLLTPSARGSQGDAQYFADGSYEEQCRHREELLHTSYDDLRAFADLCDRMMKNGGVCVVGGKEQVEACKVDSVLNL